MPTRPYMHVINMTIGRTKVYMDNIVVKSHQLIGFHNDLQENLKTLQQVNLKLNLVKCTFNVNLWIFLGHVVLCQSLKYKLEKESTVAKM